MIGLKSCLLLEPRVTGLARAIDVMMTQAKRILHLDDQSKQVRLFNRVMGNLDVEGLDAENS